MTFTSLRVQFSKRHNSYSMFLSNFQISTSVPLILAKMAAHVLIWLEVTAVIVNLVILESIVKQVKKELFETTVETLYNGLPCAADYLGKAEL